MEGHEGPGLDALFSAPTQCESYIQVLTPSLPFPANWDTDLLTSKHVLSFYIKILSVHLRPPSPVSAIEAVNLLQVLEQCVYLASGNERCPGKMRNAESPLKKKKSVRVLESTKDLKTILRSSWHLFR